MNILKYNGRVLKFNNRILGYDASIIEYPTTYTNLSDLISYVEAGDQLIMLIRHAAKTSGGSLSETGIIQSRAIGAYTANYLDKFPLGDIYCEGSNTNNRTRDTAWYITDEREDNVYTQDTVPKSDIINENAFGEVSDIGDWNDLHSFCANQANRSFIDSKTSEIMAHIESAATTKKLAVFATHDYLLTCCISSISHYEFIPNVVNGEYIVQVLNGVAIIKKPSGQKKLYFVDALNI